MSGIRLDVDQDEQAMFLTRVCRGVSIRVGTLKWSRTRHHGLQVTLIQVTPPYRRRGYAKAMLGALEALEGCEAGPGELTPMGRKWWGGLGRDVPE